MKIKETNLSFNSQLKTRRLTRRIIIHHTATSGDVSAETVHEWHLARGWSGIGYHYLIRNDGSIERGRPENVIGAHAGAEGNTDSIGIAVAGNFEVNEPDEKQIATLVELIKDIFQRYGKLVIIGHKHVTPTACPGIRFPLQEVRERAEKLDIIEVEQWKVNIIKEAKEKGLIIDWHNPDEPADKWFVLAVALNLLKVTGK